MLFSTYVVTGAGDGAGAVSQVIPSLYTAPTLRAAIVAANATPGSDTILLNPFWNGTITLTGGALDITSPVTIQGFGANRQAINGNGAGASSLLLRV